MPFVSHRGGNKRTFVLLSCNTNVTGGNLDKGRGEMLKSVEGKGEDNKISRGKNKPLAV